MPVPRSRTNRRSRFGRGKVHSKLSIGEKTHIKLEMYPIRHSPQPVFFHYQNYHILSPCLSHYQINYPKLPPCLSHYQINYCNLSPCLSHYQMRYRKLFPCLSHYQNNYCKLSPCLSHSQMRYRIFSHVCPIIKLIIAKIIPMFVPLSNDRKWFPCLSHCQINYCKLSPCLSHFQLRYRKFSPCLPHYQINYRKLSPCLTHYQSIVVNYPHVWISLMTFPWNCSFFTWSWSLLRSSLSDFWHVHSAICGVIRSRHMSLIVTTILQMH